MRKRGRGAMIAVFLIALVIFGGIWAAWSVVTTIFEPPTNSLNKQITLVIQDGESTQQIADDLQARGLIRNSLAFRLWARIKGLDKSLEAGVYVLTPGMTIDQIIGRLQNGQPDEKLVRVIDGKRLEEIAIAAGKSGLPRFNKQDFLNYVKHPETFPDRANFPILQQIPKGQSMEGFLYPDAYPVPVNYDTVKVIDMMLTEFTQAIDKNNLATQAQQHGLSEYQMIILASIIQRESGNTVDMPLISGIYWNRIKAPNDETNQLLQADPTVQYARDSANPPAQYWLPLNDKGGNIEPHSPWNTYTSQGWPPTPISSPNLFALKAAASPAQTKCYYFLSNPQNGRVVCSATYAEFVQLEARYLH
ncbi:MAG TPA: endolytic transglycosylase MltG [Ktedonobacteraceae bacterium]|nr:endolytic transglycosylase MltG [Ktedonobacteraceae bacterium]